MAPAGNDVSSGGPPNAPGEAPGDGVVPATIPQDERDGRSRFQWQSGYPAGARIEIRLETLYVATVLGTSLGAILLVWFGRLDTLVTCASCDVTTLRKYAYFFWSGVLGATVFGGKYLYHVVARGYWHQDRRLWRLLSPWLAGSLAFIIGVLMDAGFLGLTVKGSAATYVSLGFLTGYFGDKALAKMTEVADVIFGVRDGGPSRASDDLAAQSGKITKAP